MITAENVADFFLSLCDPEVGDTISNLKMQKLLYYAQGFHLALYDEPLFNENIIAWQYGPVVPEVYQEYAEFGNGTIPKPRRVNLRMISDEQKNFLKEVYEVYGQFSALRLMQMTHSEPPWINTKISDVISHSDMKEYFRSLLKEK